MSNTTSKIGFFLAGVGLGAVVAALYTPKSGKATRRMIASKAEESKDYLETRGREFRRQAEDARQDLAGPRGKKDLGQHP